MLEQMSSVSAPGVAGHSSPWLKPGAFYPGLVRLALKWSRRASPICRGT